MFFILFLLQALPSWGQSSSALSTDASPMLTSATSTSYTPWPQQVRLWNESFISPDYEATSNKSFGFIGAKLKSPPKSSALLKFDLDTAFSFNAPLLSYLNVSEIYMRLPFLEEGAPTSLEVGRRKSSWSELDGRWNLGVWEPVFKWNPLNPERQGLTGFFLYHPFESGELEFMGSPFYLPDQGPSFEVNDQGQFERGNPWFQRPAETIRIWSETSKVEYNLRRPNETQVVMQRTYSLRGRSHVGPLWGQWAYAFKPMNQLVVAYDGTLNIAKDRGVVDIVTAVQYHELTGLDLWWEDPDLKVGLSGLRDRPYDEPKFEPEGNWTKPIFQDAYIYSPFVDFDILNGLSLRLQYLEITGGEVTEVGPLADPKRGALTRRYPYTQAQSAELIYSGKKLLRKLWRSSLNFTQGTREGFELVRWKTWVQLTKVFNVFSEVSLVRSTAEIGTNSSVISDFENHDRLQLGVGYVF